MRPFPLPGNGTPGEPKSVVFPRPRADDGTWLPGRSRGRCFEQPVPGGANADVLEANRGARTQPFVRKRRSKERREAPRRAKGSDRRNVAAQGTARKANELETEDREVQSPVREKKDRGGSPPRRKYEHQEDDEAVARVNCAASREPPRAGAAPGAPPGERSASCSDRAFSAR
jgi:hypothetical protein